MKTKLISEFHERNYKTKLRDWLPQLHKVSDTLGIKTEEDFKRQVAVVVYWIMFWILMDWELQLPAMGNSVQPNAI